MSEHEAAAHGLAHGLGHKVGPLPVGAWAVVIVGGLGVGYYINRHAAASASTAPAPVDPSASTAYQTGAQGGPLENLSGVGNVGNAPSPGPLLRTNAQWRTAAIRYLVSAGNNPLASTRAVLKYLKGRPLSPTEDALVSAAIGGIGPAPQRVPIPQQEHPQSTPQHRRPHHHGAPHPHHHHGHRHAPHHGGHRLYVVHQGDTLSGIAEHHHTTWEHLAKVNHLAHPGLIRPGQHLKIPAAPQHHHAPHHRPAQHHRRDTTGKG